MRVRVRFEVGSIGEMRGRKFAKEILGSGIGRALGHGFDRWQARSELGEEVSPGKERLLAAEAGKSRRRLQGAVHAAFGPHQPGTEPEVAILGLDGGVTVIAVFRGSVLHRWHVPSGVGDLLSPAGSESKQRRGLGRLICVFYLGKNCIVVAGEGGFAVYDTKKKSVHLQMTGAFGGVIMTSEAVPINDDLFAFGCSDGQVRLWSVHNEQVSVEFPRLHGLDVTALISIRVEKNLFELVSGSLDGTMAIWRAHPNETVMHGNIEFIDRKGSMSMADTGRLTQGAQNLKVHEKGVRTLDARSVGNQFFVLSCGFDGKVMLWRIRSEINENASYGDCLKSWDLGENDCISFVQGVPVFIPLLASCKLAKSVSCLLEDFLCDPRLPTKPFASELVSLGEISIDHGAEALLSRDFQGRVLFLARNLNGVKVFEVNTAFFEVSSVICEVNGAKGLLHINRGVLVFHDEDKSHFLGRISAGPRFSGQIVLECFSDRQKGCVFLAMVLVDVGCVKVFVISPEFKAREVDSLEDCGMCCWRGNILFHASRMEVLEAISPSSEETGQETVKTFGSDHNANRRSLRAPLRVKSFISRPKLEEEVGRSDHDSAFPSQERLVKKPPCLSIRSYDAGEDFEGKDVAQFFFDCEILGLRPDGPFLEIDFGSKVQCNEKFQDAMMTIEPFSTSLFEFDNSGDKLKTPVAVVETPKLSVWQPDASTDMRMTCERCCAMLYEGEVFFFGISTLPSTSSSAACFIPRGRVDLPQGRMTAVKEMVWSHGTLIIMSQSGQEAVLVPWNMKTPELPFPQVLFSKRVAEFNRAREEALGGSLDLKMKKLRSRTSMSSKTDVTTTTNDAQLTIGPFAIHERSSRRFPNVYEMRVDASPHESVSQLNGIEKGRLVFFGRSGKFSSPIRDKTLYFEILVAGGLPRQAVSLIKMMENPDEVKLSKILEQHGFTEEAASFENFPQIPLKHRLRLCLEHLLLGASKAMLLSRKEDLDAEAAQFLTKVVTFREREEQERPFQKKRRNRTSLQ